jgi:hypothetical protein
MSRDIDILSLDFKDCWNVFKTQIDMSDSLYNEVRFGYSIKFDIYDYLNGFITIRGKAGQVTTRNGKTYELSNFNTEIEKRERKIKEYLLEVMTDEDFAKPRGMEGDE